MLEMGICSAVLNFNSGYRSLLEIFEKLCMNSGHYTAAYCVKKDTTRIHKMSSEGKRIPPEFIRCRQREKGYHQNS